MKVQKITKCTATQRVGPPHISSSVTAQEKLRGAKEILQRLEVAFAEDTETHLANGPALQENKLVREAIQKVMDDVGIPRGYSEPDPKSRARFPKQLHRDAGYLQDMQRWVKLTDGFETAVKHYESVKKVCETVIATATKTIEDEQQQRARQRQAATEQIKANVEFATILVRYGWTADDATDWSELYELLVEKDDRVQLAMAMLSVRNDWNDGCGPVEYALYVPTTDLDKQIIESVSAAVDTFHEDHDGRYFRDCEWNYDAILQTVTDQQLVRDVMSVYGRLEL